MPFPQTLLRSYFQSASHNISRAFGKCLIVLAVVCLIAPPIPAAEPDTSRGDKMIAEYFREQTKQLEDNCLATPAQVEDFVKNQEAYRGELREMLGLQPLPEKTPLHATVTRTKDFDDFTVECLHFQSMPGLYVTANVYRPKKVDKPLPAVIYVCGHGGVKIKGISYGNKVHYSHHGSWFARNGYVCIMIDSLQLGEIEGIHHGTYRYNRWWWLSRGYTPAGVEAWNCIRTIDYLESRDDVDKDRIGITGRSGGGAYSWWTAALDTRIKCAVPVAGITDLRNHVVDGCVEGHCDCMYMVNTYQWDYPMLAAMVAPRPLLISNSDRDNIFPLDGVLRTYSKARKVYAAEGAIDNIGLHITYGPHKDTQELRIHAFRWLNKHLKGDESLIEIAAETVCKPQDLKVFDTIPTDEINTKIDQTFVAASENLKPPADAAAWQKQSATWKEQLAEKSFAAWPKNDEPLQLKEVFSTTNNGLTFKAFDFTSQGPVQLRLYLACQADLKKPDLTVLNVLDQKGWADFLATYGKAFAAELKEENVGETDEKSFEQTASMLKNNKWVMAYVAPRGVGPTAWNSNERKQIQIRRRFYLLGQTLQGMQTWDARRAIAAVRQVEPIKDSPLWLQAEGEMAGVALYASIFEPEIVRLDLHHLPATHAEGPYFFNVLKALDTQQAVALAAEKSRLAIYSSEGDGEEAAKRWEFATETAKSLGWDEKQIQLRTIPKEDASDE